jgi:hypothetical protein
VSAHTAHRSWNQELLGSNLVPAVSGNGSTRMTLVNAI